MNVSLFSSQYLVRYLNDIDIKAIYELCHNNSLYYQYCPPFVTEQSIVDNMKALPPNKEAADKHYVGFYNVDQLIAVMDLIMAYPDEKTAFIGFFMTDISVQNSGTGSSIINELCTYLISIGFVSVRLGWVKGNPQAEHFWHKNGFIETGVTYDTETYTVVVAQRKLEFPGY